MQINYNKVIDQIINNKAIKATEYRSPKFIVRAVRKLYHKKIRENHNVEIILSIGSPNYSEREFIKKCKEAGEPFPIKNIQLKFYNPKPRVLKNNK